MSIWERFEGMATADEVAEAKENTFDKPTLGEHIVEIIGIEASETAQGVPILNFKFRDTATDQKYRHGMFLTSASNPQYTPQNIVAAMNFAKNVTKSELPTFTSFIKLEADIAALPLGGKSVIMVTARENSKYVDINFARPFFEVEHGDEPFK